MTIDPYKAREGYWNPYGLGPLQLTLDAELRTYCMANDLNYHHGLADILGVSISDFPQIRDLTRGQVELAIVTLQQLNREEIA